jgi:hypothetical protein
MADDSNEQFFDTGMNDYSDDSTERGREAAAEPEPIDEGPTDAAAQTTPQPDASTLDEGPQNAATPYSQSGGTYQQPPMQPTPGQQPRLWQRILTGALVGLAGGGRVDTRHMTGGGAFLSGMGAGVNANIGLAQQQKENQWKDQQMAAQQIKDMDEHEAAQARLGIYHVQMQQLQRAYNEGIPGSPEQTAKFQSMLDEASIKMGGDLRNSGNQPIFTGSYSDAMARQHAEMDAAHTSGSGNALSLISAKNPDGTWSVYHVNNPNKLNDTPVDVTIGYDLKSGKPITKTYAPGTISTVQQLQLETGAATGLVKSRNDITEYRQKQGIEASAAGTKAYNEQAGKNRADMEALKAQGGGTDSLGYTPQMPEGGVKEYNKRVDSMKKNADSLAQTDQTFRQFSAVLDDINAGKDITGAQSIVGLFNAIGISAEPLKGKGFRINNLTVREHASARGLGQSLYQKLLSLKNGDIITPQQLKDYAEIALQSRKNSYVTAVNEAHGMGLKADFLLPKGNGQKIDPNTASIFMELTGSDPAKARSAAQANRWVF